MKIEALRLIARDLDCLCEEDFQALAGITPLTAKSWRNRGRGPQPVLLGTRYFYPMTAIRQVIAEKTKDHPETSEGVIL